MNLRSVSWILPFLFFIAGYWIAAQLLQTPIITVPSLTGLSLDKGLQLLSQQRLNARIIATQYGAVETTTISDQQPQAGQTAKQSQPILLKIIQPPPLPQTPSIIGLSEEAACKKLDAAGLTLKKIDIMGSYPSQKCCAQWPAAQTATPDDQIIGYFANTTPYRIMPDLDNAHLIDVIDYCHQERIECITTHTHTPCPACIIIAQRPLPGTVINLNNSGRWYVKVRH